MLNPWYFEFPYSGSTSLDLRYLSTHATLNPAAQVKMRRGQNISGLLTRGVAFGLKRLPCMIYGSSLNMLPAAFGRLVSWCFMGLRSAEEQCVTPTCFPAYLRKTGLQSKGLERYTAARAMLTKDAVDVAARRLMALRAPKVPWTRISEVYAVLSIETHAWKPHAHVPACPYLQIIPGICGRVHARLVAGAGAAPASLCLASSRCCGFPAAGKARVARVGACAGFSVLAHDIDYDKCSAENENIQTGSGQHCSCMDLNGSAGFAWLGLNWTS